MNDVPKCPNCEQEDPILFGLMSSFWVKLDNEGCMEGDFADYESSTELSGTVRCQHCDYEADEEEFFPG